MSIRNEAIENSISVRDPAIDIRALRERDPGNWTALYQEYRRYRLPYLVRLTGDPIDAEELLHQSVLRGFERAHLLKEGSSPLAWLYTIARNLRIDDKRHRTTLEHLRYNPASLVTPQPDGEDNPEQSAIARESWAETNLGLRKLTNLERRAVLLRADGCDISTISETLGRSRQSIKIAIYRARAKLRLELAVS